MANRSRLREYARRGQLVRRSRKLAAFVENVETSIVFAQSQGRCGICNGLLSPDNFHIDHIIPLSRGGAHSYANVQAAHPHCNRAKGAKLAA